MASNPTTTLALNVLVFGGMGLVLFGLSFALLLKFAPFSVRKEIEEDQNIALAILIGAVVLGLANIVAAVVRG